MRRECTVVRYTTFVVPVNAETDAEAKALRMLNTNLAHHYITEEEYNVVNITGEAALARPDESVG